ncbi:MAG: hypothetical protein M3Q55_09210 [Acidobacteriota bacterium]|nr:hypothetical protein [Acidobacteriota bacterium]
MIEVKSAWTVVDVERFVRKHDVVIGVRANGTTVTASATFADGGTMTRAFGASLDEAFSNLVVGVERLARKTAATESR